MICTRFVQIAGGRKQDMHKGKDILLDLQMGYLKCITIFAVRCVRYIDIGFL